jgi:hypothetical protein
MWRLGTASLIFSSLSFPDASKMEDYETHPDFVDFDITEEIVKQVAWQLSGSASSGWLDL